MKTNDMKTDILFEVYRLASGQRVAYPRLLWRASPEAMQGPSLWFVALIEAPTRKQAVMKSHEVKP